MCGSQTLIRLWYCMQPEKCMRGMYKKVCPAGVAVQMFVFHGAVVAGRRWTISYWLCLNW